MSCIRIFLDHLPDDYKHETLSYIFIISSIIIALFIILFIEHFGYITICDIALYQALKFI